MGQWAWKKDIDSLGIFLSEPCALLLALNLGEIKALILIPTKKPFLGFSNKEVGKVSANQFACGYFWWKENKSHQVNRMRGILKTKKHDVSLLYVTLYIFLTDVPPSAHRTVDSHPQQAVASFNLAHYAAQTFLLNKRL